MPRTEAGKRLHAAIFGDGPPRIAEQDIDDIEAEADRHGFDAGELFGRDHERARIVGLIRENIHPEGDDCVCIAAAVELITGAMPETSLTAEVIPTAINRAWNEGAAAECARIAEAVRSLETEQNDELEWDLISRAAVLALLEKTDA